MIEYKFKQIEIKWQNFWKKNKTYQVKDLDKKDKFYILDMFPYPSGEGLHVGHPKGYVATDVYSRYKRLQGFNVLHPMGFDSFGLPAENYAIKNNIHPEIAVKKNIKRYKEQLSMFGFDYDWDREIITSDPEYYKWTQWIFLQIFKAGLAYESNEPVNWCPKCKTVLSNEDLENGKCERCETQIEKKPLRQWVLKMTKYAERLLDELKYVNWEKSIIDQQINWIGKSQGSLIKFQIVNDKLHKNNKSKSDYQLEIFTTRADTLFGATFMVISPEHSLITSLFENQNCKLQITNKKEIKKYQEQAKKKSDLERTDLSKDKTGVRIEGIKAINPVNGKKLPIFIADYVLSSYGTGAIMAVPAHDERDWEFAKQFKIPIIQVIKKTNKDKLPFIDDGSLINSGKFSGLDCKVAQKEITKLVKGKITTKYKMRDWVFSRQRYWGEPFPLVYCKNCKKLIENNKKKIQIIDKVEEVKINGITYNKGELSNPGWIAIEDLPVKLPEIKSYKPTGTGESPLANISDWVNTRCPKCKGLAKRETNTMPQWAGSSWYYLRYIDPKNKKRFTNQKKEKYWMCPNGVDFYVGGAEHATRHLLYARFWHKFLYDIKAVSTKEPFNKLQHVGLINGEDGRKMSKRWHNVVNPDEVIKKFGADAFRMYEMFMGPFADSIDWNTAGVKGTKRFLDKVWRYFQFEINSKKHPKETDKHTLNDLNKMISNITNNIESFRLNTAISELMKFINKITKGDLSGNQNQQEQTPMAKKDLESFLIVLSPFAPHISEELWNQIGNKKSIFISSWPKVNNIEKDSTMKIAVMVNGKTRGILEIEIKKTETEVLSLAKKIDNVKKYLENKKLVKEIYISGKIVSFVIK